jgi:hypothetical protein
MTQNVYYCGCCITHKLICKKPLSYCPHKTYRPYGAFTLDLKSILVLEERRGEVVVVVVGVQLKPILE